MGGVTPHGIRYPDGASKAKNLGPELKTMAEDIDWYIGSYLSPTGPIRQIIIGVAEEVVPPIVQRELEDLGPVVAIPTGAVGTSSRDRLPIGWTNRTMNDAYSDTYSDTYTATWTTGGFFGKDVPLLRNDTGVLFDSVIPSNVARKSDIPDSFEATIPERTVTPLVPIFGARVAAAIIDQDPCAVAFAGSSTTATMPGYVVRLMSVIQQAYNVAGNQSAVQKDSDAIFSKLTRAGLHGYNAGQFGLTSANYLTDEESDRMMLLEPALFLHMIGSNDFRNQMAPATYRANLEDRLDYLDGKATKPVQHLLIHAYERFDFTPATYEWNEYRDVLADIADDRGEGVAFIDLSAKYAAVGVPSSDPLDLIQTDNIHQTPRGNRFMADLIASRIVA